MSGLESIFENQPKILSPEQAALLIGSTRSTIYDMNYRPRKYGAPKEMFIKNGRRLLVRTDIFKQWFIERAS
jgi:predicted DNA-binding transcriptional regulator AlpA